MEIIDGKVDGRDVLPTLVDTLYATNKVIRLITGNSIISTYDIELAIVELCRECEVKYGNKCNISAKDKC